MYNVSQFISKKELEEQVIKDIFPSVVGKKLNDLKITSISKVNLDTDSKDIMVSLENGKTFALFLAASKSGNTTVDLEKVNSIFTDAVGCSRAFDKLAEEEEKKQHALQKKLEDEAKEKMRAQIRAIKNQEKLKTLKKKNIDKFKEFSSKKVSANSDYVAIGWLAKNVSTVFATIPDYLEDYFISHFGKDSPVTVVDTRELSSGGYLKQWSFSFAISVKTLDNIPLSLKQIFDGKKKINNTEFVWKLVDEYGFNFGKSQDIDHIIDEVPAANREEFMVGYAS